MDGKGLTHGDLRGGRSWGLRAQAEAQGQEVLARLLAGQEARPGSSCPSRPYLEGDRRAACCRPPWPRAWTAARSRSDRGAQGHRPPGASECPSCSSWSTEDPRGGSERERSMGEETLRLGGAHKAGGRGGCLVLHIKPRDPDLTVGRGKGGEGQYSLDPRRPLARPGHRVGDRRHAHRAQ